jgi:hypothetical protein
MIKIQLQLGSTAPAARQWHIPASDRIATGMRLCATVAPSLFSRCDRNPGNYEGTVN